MRNLLKFTALLSMILIIFSCRNKPGNEAPGFIDENVAFAASQYEKMVQAIEDSGKILNPKSYIDGKMKYIRPQEWTSGFFPGSLWYLYELTGDEKWKSHQATVRG